MQMDASLLPLPLHGAHADAADRGELEEGKARRSREHDHELAADLRRNGTDFPLEYRSRERSRQANCP